MANCYIILNHSLTYNQTQDLKYTWNVRDRIYFPKYLADRWRNICPEKGDPQMPTNILYWLWSEGVHVSDPILIQGEMGTTFKTVSLLIQEGLTPVYATSYRTLLPGGGKKFTHVKFKPYKM